MVKALVYYSIVERSHDKPHQLCVENDFITDVEMSVAGMAHLKKELKKQNDRWDQGRAIIHNIMLLEG